MALSVRAGPRARAQGERVRDRRLRDRPTGETQHQAKARRAGGCFTLAEAREERAKARALVRQDINPAHQRHLDRIQREREGKTTFEVVAAEWLGLKDWEEVTKRRRRDMLVRVVFPKSGRCR